VKDVDTTAAGFNSSRVEGYYLHVMDSTKRESHENSIIEVDGKAYNRLNYVYAKRTAANELELKNGRVIKNDTINEYRFYFQESGVTDQYYLVTEAGYGDGGRSNMRGYLSMKYDTIYVGPREGALKVQFLGSTVSNVIIAPVKEEANEIAIIGQTGQIDIHNAAGQPISVYNILGRLIAQRTATSNLETITVPRGILIVKAGPLTRKVVVQ